ncbi:MAG: cupin domain-containing protein [Thiotrichaceae bacterium]|nr:cupin domain-containing protein [Thiotrichaceae bacterium]
MKSQNNLFENIPDNLDEEVFEQIVSSEQISIERIISKGHHSPTSDWYDQDKNEWVMVLAGKAILSFDDGSDIMLNKGDYINIPAHKRHRVKWTEPMIETIWLAIFY